MFVESRRHRRGVSQIGGLIRGVLRWGVKRFLSLLFRWGYFLLVVACTGYLLGQLIQRTEWHRQRLYQQLASGDAGEQAEAAIALARLGAQEQLLEALRLESEPAREAARRALDFIWSNAAGPEAFEMAERAIQALEEEEPGQALEILDQLTRRYPRFADGWNRPASVHWELGAYELSMADCRRALSLNPNLFAAWQGIGVCQLELGDIPGACESLRRALEIIPFDESTRESLRRCEGLLRVYPHEAGVREGELLI